MDLSPRVAKFCEYWDSRNSRVERTTSVGQSYLPVRLRAINKAIENAFPDLASLTPPIDVRGLARRRRIRDIEYRTIGGDGQISQTPNGDYIVTVNSEHSELRQRFTIAHEIAHTLFFEAFGEESLAQSGYIYEEGSDPDEERMCDYVAARILLPTRQVEDFLRINGVGASSVVALAQEFRCSLRAAARCLLQKQRLKCLVVYWEQEEKFGDFIARWRESTDQGQAGGRVLMSVGPKEPAYNDFQSAKHFLGRYWMRLGGPLDRYFVDAFAFSSSPRRVLTLVVLDGAAEMFFGRGVPVASENAAQATLF